MPCARRAQGPYALIWAMTSMRGSWAAPDDGYPVMQHVRGLLDQDVIWCPILTGGVVLTLRGGDFQLHVGLDAAIGWRQPSHRQRRGAVSAGNRRLQAANDRGACLDARIGRAGMSWLCRTERPDGSGGGVRIPLRRHRTPDSRAAWLLIVVALPWPARSCMSCWAKPMSAIAGC